MDKLIILKIKPTIKFFLFFGKIILKMVIYCIFKVRNHLINSILLAVCKAMYTKLYRNNCGNNRWNLLA